MARVYRHGKRKKLYIEYRSHSGKLCREPAYRSKELSIAHLAKILEREELIRAGRLEPSDGPVLSISQLLARWKAHMQRKGDGESHARWYHYAAERVCVACGFTDARSIDGAAAQHWMERQCSAETMEVVIRNKRPSKAWTNRTYQWYRSALLAFGYWLADKERAVPANPFRGIDSRNPEINPRIVRRALTEDEFARLLEATRKGGVKYGLSGEQRFHLYAVAARTGLRFRALRNLTPSSFDLAAGTVASGMRLQKNRKALTLPLSPDVVKLFRKWLKGKDHDALLWPMADSAQGSKMIQHDLRAAKIPFKTAEGQVDFHSLRHSFATSLVRSGATQTEVQTLLDHCSPALSARYFRHLQTDELRGVVGKLPRV